MRRIVIVAITKHGAQMGRRLIKQMESYDLWYMDKFRQGDEEALGIQLFSGSVRKVLPELFKEYEGIILIISLGAVIRMIAPLLQDKKTDPAIVVMDDRGENVISVLSGHLGGANELTRQVANQLGASPIITTASDVQKTIPVDLFGREFGWEIESFDRATPVSAAVVNEETVALIQESGERDWWKYDKPLPSHLHLFSSTEEAQSTSFQAALVVTHRLLSNDEEDTFLRNGVLYRPKVIVLGMGCNRGTSLEELEQVVLDTLAEQRLSITSVRNIATIDIKQDESGLIALAEKYGWGIEVFTPEQLNQIKLSNPSETVYRFTGAYGVCEPAALLSAGAQNWLLEKKKSGNVTLSIALVDHLTQLYRSEVSS
ncbi:cobalt-precorrin 5A hydrolase [Marininema halotolerans]|uniref:Cobalt-precorrin 5A hydrolase n=1 Tax=Marininema halotolerans TaxID=1155944 RepID=A0A1I6QLV8_9BACL|nr:cobalamin biosynthesis protein [Marininema halotolerans]SFS53441.1 cobalt-precorrin 5A hydrolase [Marininema halotolerans]